jgi:hypothetical protein
VRNPLSFPCDTAPAAGAAPAHSHAKVLDDHRRRPPRRRLAAARAAAALRAAPLDGEELST